MLALIDSGATAPWQLTPPCALQIRRCSAHQLCWLGRGLDCGWRSRTTRPRQCESSGGQPKVGRLDGRGKQVPPPCARLSAPVWGLAVAPACPHPWVPSVPLQVPLLRFSPPRSTLKHTSLSTPMVRASVPLCPCPSGGQDGRLRPSWPASRRQSGPLTPPARVDGHGLPPTRPRSSPSPPPCAALAWGLAGRVVVWVCTRDGGACALSA